MPSQQTMAERARAAASKVPEIKASPPPPPPPPPADPSKEMSFDELFGDDIEDSTRLSFADSGLPAPLLKALATTGMEHAHLEQFRSVKVLVEHPDLDLIVNAPTGSGKTLIGVLSCLLPIVQDLERIKEEVANPKRQVRNFPSTRSLYMTPVTCTIPQIVEQFLEFTRSLGLPDTVVHAVNPAQDIRHELASSSIAKILVGTPHQLMKLINPTVRGVSTINASGAKISVVDEIDWIHQQHSHEGHLSQSDAMYRVFQSLNRDIRMVLMGATMTDEVMEVMKKYLRPRFVTLKGKQSSTVLGHIQHFKVEIEDSKYKPAVLGDIVPKLRAGGIVFASNPKEAHEILMAVGMKPERVAAVCKDTPKDEIKRLGQEFRHRKFDVFICDDSHCRGFDASHVYWVFNYDLPTGDAWWDTMHHRLGRSGRHLSTGKTITLLTADNQERFEKFAESTHISFAQLPDLDSTAF